MEERDCDKREKKIQLTDQSESAYSRRSSSRARSNTCFYFDLAVIIES